MPNDLGELATKVLYTQMAKSPSDRYLRMYNPILRTIEELGGSGTPKEVIPQVLSQFNFTPEQLIETTKSGANRVENEVRWAAAYLKDLGFLETQTQGVWTITMLGRETILTIEDARKERAAWLKKQNLLKKGAPLPEEIEEDEDPAEQLPSLLEVILSLPPIGFERLCQRLLRVAGFQEVHVTKQSGDGGIDGNGILQVNPLVSFRVLFQCKRYKDSVSSSTVRDFRGAMQGRTDMGIILTTGTFTAEAQKEAARDGAPPIELVDGERLVGLMEEHGLGVKERKVYDVDLAFFDAFRI